jgi:hypothetical protein
MGRASGVPTRYVEGFYIDLGKADGAGYVYVTEADAHAWIEAYVDDRGWVVFDATPPYYSLQEEAAAEVPDGEGEDEGILPSSGDQMDFKDSMVDENMIIGDGEAPSGSGAGASGVAVKILFFMVIICGLYIIIVVTMQKKYYGRSIVNEIYFIEVLCKTDTDKNLTIGEALTAYGPNISPAAIDNIHAILYGPEERFTEAQISMVEETEKLVREQYISEYGQLSYLLLRYFRKRS